MDKLLINVMGGNAETQKLILQACIPFKMLRENAKFFYRPDPNENPYNEKTSERVSEYYQRRIDFQRVKAIKKYLRKAILSEKNSGKVYAIFPTALLLAFYSDDTNYVIGHQDKLDMPQDFFIVDGQHRLFSMMELYKDVSMNGLFSDTDFYNENTIIKDYLDTYQFNCTIMLNFDMWEQAQIFADVNFNQKSVNKSLFYEIYGMRYSNDPDDKYNNGIYIAHNLVKFVNELDESPLKKSVKMLGNSKGIVSQACLVEALMRHITSPQGIWYIKSYDKTIPSYKYMAVELVSYLSVLKEVFNNYWPENNDHKSILCKTTGIGALIRLMGDIHIIHLSDSAKSDLKTNEGYMSVLYKQEVKDLFSKLNDEEKAKLFSKEGNYSGTGGKGLANGLYVELKRILFN